MTGSIQVKNGKYYAVINLYENGKRKQKWISTNLEIKGNKKKAEQFLRDKIKEYELKLGVISTDVLFCDYFLHWLEIAKLQIETVTFQGYSSVVKNHLYPYFKNLNKKLVDVTREDIQQYINYKYKCGNSDGTGLSPRSVKLHKTIMQLAIKTAIKEDLIYKNPCEFVVLPKQKKYQANFYTNEQLNKLFECIKNEELYVLIYFTVLFGLRRSEVLGLKWDSVNFENNTITIKHTVVKFSEIIEKDTTKNNSSNRTYPLSEDVKKMLLNLKETEKENKYLFGTEYINNDYIFKWSNGQPYSPDYLSKNFARLLKKYELPHIRFHDLRHSCGSLLIAKGFTLKDIQEWLGHADIQTTANIYLHLDIERKNSIVNSLTSALEFY